jgi:RNA recognition motif-containing protein
LSVRLFIGNLPFAATEADLRTHFSSVGTPQQVVLPMDRATGRPRGFAFVEFESRETAEEAIRKFDRQIFMGRPLAVSEARGRDERPAGPRPGGGGFAPRPAGGGGFGRPMSAPADSDTSPAARDRSRNFGPDARPRRGGGGPSRRQQAERGPKGPIREKPGGRVYSVDEDDVDEPIDFDNFATRAEDASEQPDDDSED